MRGGGLLLVVVWWWWWWAIGEMKGRVRDTTTTRPLSSSLLSSSGVGMEVGRLLVVVRTMTPWG